MEIIREDYLKMLISSKDMPSTAKILTGMRRTGKTTIMNQYVERLHSMGIGDGNILHINLDLLVDTPDRSWLLEQAEPVLENEGMHYILIDEIQDVDGWERFVAMLIARGDCDVYITGSNSKMLSSELATKLSGRYIEIDVLPLSFKEYMELYPGDKEERFNEYLRFGGLPMIDPGRGETICSDQSEGVFNTVMMKDILSRVSGNARRLTAICRFLYSNIGNVTNADRISETLGIPKDDVYKYMSEIVSAHLFYHADKYDIVGKKYMKSKGKYYATDLGMRLMALKGSGTDDLSHPLENAVYLELLRRGYTVRVGSYRDKEVDFTAIRGNEVEYYQVAMTVLGEDTRKREIASLESIRDNFPKTILTMDRFNLGSFGGIRVSNVIDWMLGSG